MKQGYQASIQILIDGIDDLDEVCDFIYNMMEDKRIKDWHYLLEKEGYARPVSVDIPEDYENLRYRPTGYNYLTEKEK